jgi:nucleotide-binding universal stress UspA family protein
MNSASSSALLRVNTSSFARINLQARYVKARKADLLVVGFMGHSALYERIIGGTADRLVRLAPCPVLVAK